jgi:hypothetical protein
MALQELSINVLRNEPSMALLISFTLQTGQYPLEMTSLYHGFQQS